MTYADYLRPIVVAVAMASVAGTGLAMAQGAATAEGAIKVGQVGEDRLSDPGAAGWKSVPAASVELATAFAGHPSIVGEATTAQLRIQAASSGKELYIRLQWSDSSPNRNGGVGRFADGVAVQFAADGSTDTQPFMGGEGRRVNIWYWNAGRKAAENLVADGFGTLTRAEIQDVQAIGVYAGGTWTVVFRRTLKAASDDNASLSIKPGANLPVAFAVWNGANSERDGFKAVTVEWQQLRF